MCSVEAPAFNRKPRCKGHAGTLLPHVHVLTPGSLQVAGRGLKSSTACLWSRTEEESGRSPVPNGYIASDRNSRGSWKGGTEQEGRTVFVKVTACQAEVLCTGLPCFSSLRMCRAGSFVISVCVEVWTGGETLHSDSQLVPTRLKQQRSNLQVS